MLNEAMPRRTRRNARAPATAAEAWADLWETSTHAAVCARVLIDDQLQRDRRALDNALRYRRDLAIVVVLLVACASFLAGLICGKAIG